MERDYVLIDGNSIGFAAHQSTKLSVGGQQVQAVFGIIKTIRGILDRFDALQPIVLWDGRSWRKDVYPAYKAHREADAKVRLMREAYKSQRPLITRGLNLLGVWQMQAANLEADDLAGIMVHRARAKGRQVIMVSGDQDWLQLVQPGVGWIDPIRDATVTRKNFEQFTGFAHGRAFLEGKALQGDAGDFGSGSGVGGIGEKGAQELLAKYGSVENFHTQIAAEIALSQKVPKKWADFHFNTTGGREIFDRNMKLMDLDPKVLPLPIDMKVDRGSLDVEGFTDFCNELAFRSITLKLEQFLGPFEHHANAIREAA